MAWPELTPTLTQPEMAVPPSLNVTVPVASDGDTVAVKVTSRPKMDGFSDEPRPVVVLALFTCWFGESVPVEAE